MAHEIKNPLVSIRTFIDLMDEHYEDTDFRQQFSAVVRQDVNTINVLTNKLVGFAGHITYHFEPGCVNNILSTVKHLHRSENQDTSVDFVDTYIPIQSHGGEDCPITLECDEGLPKIRFDAEQLHNALMYIIVFLTQVSESQEPIRIVSYRAAGLHGDVCISLTGSQAKVEPEEIERLFDPFASEHNILVDVGPCVSQKIIEAHNGQLDVEYRANRDLVFVMSLPPAE
jgi:nitrogen-specific signal transduction histidine kinase